MEIFIIFTFKREGAASLVPKMPLELDTAWNLLMRYQTSASFLTSTREAEHLRTAELVIWLEAASPCIRYYENTMRQKLYPILSQDLTISLPCMRGSLGVLGIPSEGLYIRNLPSKKYRVMITVIIRGKFDLFHQSLFSAKLLSTSSSLLSLRVSTWKYQWYITLSWKMSLEWLGRSN